MDLLRNIKKAFIEPLQLKLRLMVSRGIVTLVNDATKLQELQVDLLAGETVDQAERFQQYGFTSHPFGEAEAVALFPAGDRSHCLVIAVDDRRYRLKNLGKGEVALYDDQGQAVHLKRDKHIHIHGCDKLTVDAVNDIIANTKNATVNASESCTVNTKVATVDAEESVLLDTPSVHCTHDVQVDGSLTVTGNGSFGGGLTMTGASGPGSGNISTPGTLAVAGQISSDTGVSIGALELGTHVHGNVQSGSSNTGGPGAPA